jgi:hypothetical protein
VCLLKTRVSIFGIFSREEPNLRIMFKFCDNRDI